MRLTFTRIFRLKLRQKASPKHKEPLSFCKRDESFRKNKIVLKVIQLIFDSAMQLSYPNIII